MGYAPAMCSRFATAMALALALAGCGLTPSKPAPTHIRSEPPRSEGTIPPPVQVAPVLPKPKPSPRPETYSVVVSRVPVQELLFALARDARLQIDIHPDVSGTVTLNAIDQTLPQLLNRIAQQINMRYEIDGDNLHVLRDTPYLRSYKVDYLSASRNVKMQSATSSQFAAGGGGGGAGGAAAAGGGSSGTGGTATVDVSSEHKLWESLVQNVREILRETDRILPAGAAQPTPAAAPAAPAAPPAGQQAAPPAAAAQAGAASGPTFQEAASVIANREAGVLFVRATSRQHEKVQEFLDQVMVGVKRQVLIEATVVEVQLRNEYQRGIDWSRLRSGITGFQFRQSNLTPPAGFNPSPFLLGYATAHYNFAATLTLLEQFGDIKVLSSPKLSVLNNQTAILRVTRDIIYFTVTPATQTVAATSLIAPTVEPAFTTTPNVAVEGFMMSVLPQINETDSVVLNVRPTIRRQVGSINDPNPALSRAGTTNAIPVFETREFDSILRLQSGEVAVLAGLMQDSLENTETGIPGVRSIPGIGQLLSQRTDLSRKTELVIFLRATVIRDPSVDGDFRNFRDLLPNQDFLLKPNPSRVAPPLGPDQAR
jgi:general secretion pathway protein D